MFESPLYMTRDINIALEVDTVNVQGYLAHKKTPIPRARTPLGRP